MILARFGSVVTDKHSFIPGARTEPPLFLRMQVQGLVRQLHTDRAEEGSDLNTCHSLLKGSVLNTGAVAWM